MKRLRLMARTLWCPIYHISASRYNVLFLHTIYSRCTTGRFRGVSLLWACLSSVCVCVPVCVCVCVCVQATMVPLISFIRRCALTFPHSWTPTAAVWFVDVRTHYACVCVCPTDARTQRRSARRHREPEEEMSTRTGVCGREIISHRCPRRHRQWMVDPWQREARLKTHIHLLTTPEHTSLCIAFGLEKHINKEVRVIRNPHNRHGKKHWLQQQTHSQVHEHTHVHTIYAQSRRPYIPRYSYNCPSTSTHTHTHTHTSFEVIQAQYLDFLLKTWLLSVCLLFLWYRYWFILCLLVCKTKVKTTARRHIKRLNCPLTEAT